MKMFKRIAYVAAFAGLLAGLLLTAAQQIRVIPILLQSEVYEEAAAAKQAQTAPAHAGHEHEPDEWQPENGWQRTAFTAAANIVLSVAFALLLAATISLRGETVDWRRGLLWGLAGYVVFFVAPSLGLPPELPGTEAAALGQRQLWWILTVTLTAVGLGMLVFVRHWAIKIAGVALLAVPHLVGAPHPQMHSSTAPAELITAFIIATIITNAVFWLALGGLTGFFYKKMA